MCNINEYFVKLEYLDVFVISYLNVILYCVEDYFFKIKCDKDDIII